jgi:hypothetical protein
LATVATGFDPEAVQLAVELYEERVRLDHTTRPAGREAEVPRMHASTLGAAFGAGERQVTGQDSPRTTPEPNARLDMALPSRRERGGGAEIRGSDAINPANRLVMEDKAHFGVVEPLNRQPDSRYRSECRRCRWVGKEWAAWHGAADELNEHIDRMRQRSSDAKKDPPL